MSPASHKGLPYPHTSLTWQGQSRRLSKDYELLCRTSEIVIYVCMIRLMLRRFTRR